MFIGNKIYIRHVVISIILSTVMISIETFYLTQLCSFIGYLLEYLTLSPLQVCGISLTSFNDFKAFWTCSFTNPTVKGIYNFWKVRGLIDGFNNSCRQIVSGLVRNANESISAIHYHTTPKGDLPHYYYIFRNLNTLGTEINNVSCYRLGTMLHLEIQKGKEDTDILPLKKYQSD